MSGSPRATRASTALTRLVLEVLWGGKNLTRAQIRDADSVLELLWLVFTTVRAAVRPHQDLVLENLLLRHQLAVLTRPTRRQPYARLRLLGQAGVDSGSPTLRQLV